MTQESSSDFLFWIPVFNVSVLNVNALSHSNWISHDVIGLGTCTLCICNVADSTPISCLRYVDIIHIVVDMMITVFFISCLPFTVLGYTTILIYEHEHKQ